MKNFINSIFLGAAILTSATSYAMDYTITDLQANIKNQIKYTELMALHNAIWSGNIQEVQFCLNEKTNMNLQDNTGRTPLHVAMYKGNIEIIKILLQHCAQHKDSKFYDSPNINLQDRNGNTPLHVAAFMGNIDFVKLLLKSGAKHMPNRFHNSPYDIATHFKHANVALLLARHWENSCYK